MRSFVIGFCLIVTYLTFSCSIYAGNELTTNKEDTMVMPETIIYADLFIRNFKQCRVELYVNGIPVGRAGGGMQPYVATPTPEFLLDGENKLEVILGAGSTPATSRLGEKSCAKAESGMEVVARLVRFIDGEMTGPGKGETLAEIVWTGEKEDAFPMTLNTTADLGKQFGEWKWQTAEKLTLDEATINSAIEFIQMIQDNYSKCNPEEIVKFAKFKHEEAVRSYPAYGDIDFNEMFIEQLKEMSQHPQWKPDDLPREEYDLRLVADGRMIETISKEWRPIIRMSDGNFGYPMMIGRIDGKWQILR